MLTTLLKTPFSRNFFQYGSVAIRALRRIQDPFRAPSAELQSRIPFNPRSTRMGGSTNAPGDDSAKFLESFCFQYGRASIADLGHLVLCFEGISELAATEVEDEQLWQAHVRFRTPNGN